MKLDLLPIQEACANLRETAEEEQLSEDFRQSFYTFLDMLSALYAFLQEPFVRPTSQNSQLTSSRDLTRGTASREKGSRKPGGETGHPGNTFKAFANPDKLVGLKPENIPFGFRKVTCERRQKTDIKITRCVTECRACICENDAGRLLYASFPEEVKRLVQYGDTVRMEVACQYAGQLIPFSRIWESLGERAWVPISEGTIHTFLLKACRRLEGVERWNCFRLLRSPVNHFDETGCRIGGERLWLYSASNGELTLYMSHEKRGAEGKEAMGLLPLYQGTAVHDFQAPYRGYSYMHAVCTVHVLRELAGSQWPVWMQNLLKGLNKSRIDGKLTEEKVQVALREYDDILSAGEKECPLPLPHTGKKGRQVRGKSRRLTHRLRKHKEEVLLFLTRPEVPFSNNQAERDIRMSKVKQKNQAASAQWMECGSSVASAVLSPSVENMGCRLTKFLERSTLANCRSSLTRSWFRTTSKLAVCPTSCPQGPGRAPRANARS